ncbi:hypothetical protein LTR56_026625 [Elasticomyces elasticus]|nr:hypothetical protein LTR56_026625 [Elasticomyces elasticus]KAK5736183.1 hypothetical protein LTS12_026252 [Elasticomyces elasticus]
MADTFVVGIDFAAYSANPESPDEINIIKTCVTQRQGAYTELILSRWSGGNKITSDKVPSEVAYGSRPAGAPVSQSGRLGSADPFNFDGLKNALDTTQRNAQDSQMRWGFQIRTDEDRLRCLKLFLDPSQAIPRYVSLPDTQRQLVDCGKTVDTVVAEYLRALFTHTKDILGRRYGQQFVASTPLTVVLTVPAVWSDAAKNATFKAAEAAGMGDEIRMISEPEAAAVYTLQAIQPNHLKVGHNFVVIDAGGGTVDLISYTIRQLKPLRLEELAKGSGGFCGAAFLNVRFEQFVSNKLGAETFAEIRDKKPKSWLVALKYFEEHVKRNFDPEDDLEFNIAFPGVPDNADAGIEGGFLVMDSSEVTAIFRPIVADIIIFLIEGQINQLQSFGLKVDGLVLVGGFGQSECLLKCLKGRFSRGASSIEIFQPVNAWTSVVRGAVLRGLEGSEMVTNRKARRHYGVEYREPFPAGRHPNSCKEWDNIEERWVAANRMEWFIKKGQTVSSTEPVLFDFYVSFDAGHSRTLTEELIICDADVAPKGFDSKAGAVTRVACKMVVNVNSVPRHLFEEHRNSQGRSYQCLSFQLGMQVESGGLRFDFRVDGVVYGKVAVTFL